MSNTAFDLSRQSRALAPIREEIKDLCESIGIDVQAAEEYAKNNKLLLPWHEAVTPEASLQSARKIFDNRPEAGLTAVEVVDRFISSTAQSQVPVGLIGALAAVGDRFLDSPAKAGFLSHFPHEVYSFFTMPPLFKSSPDPDGVRGALCWLVHDVLAAEALHKITTPLSREGPQVVDMLVEHSVISLVHCGRQIARSEETDFNPAKELEDTLINLSLKCPHTKSRVSALHKVFSQECELADGSDLEDDRLLNKLQCLYPDPFLEPNLNGETIAKESSAMTEAYRATLALTERLKEPMTSQPEWSNPLGEAAEEIRTKRLVRVNFGDSDLLTSPRAREVLLDLLSQAPGTTVALSFDQFFTRRPSDPPLKDLVDSLNHFIQTDQESCLMYKTNQPDFQMRKERTVSFLRAVINEVGSKKVLVVSPSDTESFNAPEGAHICLITQTSGTTVTETQGKVTIFLKRVEPDDSQVKKMRNSLQMDLPEVILAGNIQSAILRAVVPTLGQQDTPRDKHGLNGVWTAAIGLTLSEASIEGVGQFPLLTKRHFNLSDRGLVIQYTGEHEEPEEDQPVDAEDTPLEGDRADSSDFVGSKRS